MDRSPRSSPASGGNSTPRESAASSHSPRPTGDAVREALLALTSKEVATVRAALEVIRRVAAGPAMERGAIHVDSGVQRLSFLVGSLAGGSSLKNSLPIVELALESLWLLIGEDDAWAAVVAKECGSRVFAQLLRLHITSPVVARHACLILAALSWHERSVGLVARLEGGIALLLSIIRDPEVSIPVLLPALDLLVIYARSSENNVHVLVKRDGVPVIVELARRFQHTEAVLLPCLQLLGSVGKHARHASAMCEMGVVKTLTTMLSARGTSSMIAEVGVTVLSNMCSDAATVAAMWESGAFHTLWVVITRHASSSVGAVVLKTATATLWKMLSLQGIGFPLDLDMRETWDIPPFPTERGLGRYLERGGGVDVSADAEAATDSEADVDGKEDCDVDGADVADDDDTRGSDDETGAGSGPSPDGDDPSGGGKLDDEAGETVEAELWAPRHPSTDSLGSASRGTSHSGKSGRRKKGGKASRRRSPATGGAGGAGGGSGGVAGDGKEGESKRSVAGSSTRSMASEDDDDPEDGAAAAADEGFAEWFPEDDDAQVAGDTATADEAALRRDQAFVYPTTVSLDENGTSSTDAFVLPASDLPSAFGTTRSIEPEPMTPITDEARAALVQRMMLSVVARLALPKPSGGEVVYDRFTGVSTLEGAARCILRTGRDRESRGGTPGLTLRLPSVDADSPARTSRPRTSSTSGVSATSTPSPGSAAAVAAAHAAASGADLSSLSEADDPGFAVRRILADVAADAAVRPSVPPLHFESRFETGNLRSAVRVGAREYELLVSPDTNTGGHTQWFYFRVRGMEPGMPYKFNIVNLEKSGSTYNEGMRPLMYCIQRPEGADEDDYSSTARGHGWRRAGEDVCYYQNHYTKQKAGVALSATANNAAAAAASAPLPELGSGIGGAGAVSDAEEARDPGQMSLYTFTWTVTFPERTHTAFFAHCFPYSYWDLQEDLAYWRRRAARAGRGLCVQLDERQNTLLHPPSSFEAVVPSPRDSIATSSIMRECTFCRTLSGNPVPLLTITDFNAPPAEIRNRPYVVLSARVHPGETNASWMMRGIIDFLTSSVAEAEELRRKVVFKVIPFLNPDGVINGHHRTNLSGVDLNRHWTSPMRGRTPTVYYMRQLLGRCQQRRVIMFCDLHGHSRRKNIFIFGCENSEGVPERLFPKLLDRRAPDFQYRSCNFKVQKSKANCARVAVCRDFRITNSYTMESSFAGADSGPNRDMHFKERNYEEMGHHFVAALVDLLDPTCPAYVEESANLRELHPSKFISAEEKKRRRGKKKKGKSGSGQRKSSTKGKSALPPKASRGSGRSGRR